MTQERSFEGDLVGITGVVSAGRQIVTSLKIRGYRAPDAVGGGSAKEVSVDFYCPVYLNSVGHAVTYTEFIVKGDRVVRQQLVDKNLNLPYTAKLRIRKRNGSQFVVRPVLEE